MWPNLRTTPDVPRRWLEVRLTDRRPPRTATTAVHAPVGALRAHKGSDRRARVHRLLARTRRRCTYTARGSHGTRGTLIREHAVLVSPSAGRGRWSARIRPACATASPRSHARAAERLAVLHGARPIVSAGARRRRRLACIGATGRGRRTQLVAVPRVCTARSRRSSPSPHSAVRAGAARPVCRRARGRASSSSDHAVGTKADRGPARARRSAVVWRAGLAGRRDHVVGSRRRQSDASSHTGSEGSPPHSGRRRARRRPRRRCRTARPPPRLLARTPAQGPRPRVVLLSRLRRERLPVMVLAITPWSDGRATRSRAVLRAAAPFHRAVGVLVQRSPPAAARSPGGRLTERYLEFDLGEVAHDGEGLAVLWAVMRADAFVVTRPGQRRPPRPRSSRSSLSVGRHGRRVARQLQQGVREALSELAVALAEACRGGGPRAAMSSSIAHTRLSAALSALRGGPRARAGVAPHLPSQLSGRRLAAPCRRRSMRRVVGRPSGDLASRPRGVRARRPSGHGVQQPASSRRRRRRLARRPASATRPCGASCDCSRRSLTIANRDSESLSTARYTAEARGRGRVPQDSNGRGIRRARCRGARGRLRTPARCLARGRARARSTGAAAAGALDAPRRARRKESGTFYTPRRWPTIWFARPSHPLVRAAGADESSRCGSSTRRWGAARFSSPPAVSWPTRTTGARPEGRTRVRRHPTARAPGSAADRAALPLRRRHQPGRHGPRAAVAVARDARGRRATHLSRSPSSRRQQPARRVGRRFGARLAGEPAQGQSTLSGAWVPARAPLIEGDTVAVLMRDLVPLRARLAGPDETAGIVRDKDRALEGSFTSGGLARLLSLADAWSAWFSWPGPGPAPPRTAWAELTDHAIAGTIEIAGWPRRALARRGAPRGRRAPVPSLAAAVSRGLLQRRRRAAAGRGLRRHRRQPALGHGPRRRPRCRPRWAIERARPRAHAVRARVRRLRRTEGRAREPVSALHRARARSRSGWRAPRSRGAVGPGLGPLGGTSASAAARALRHRVGGRLRERGGDLPIHRSQRFLLFTATTGRPTRGVRCRLGARSLDVLVRTPEAGVSEATGDGVVLAPAFLRRVSGEGLELPWLRGAADLALLDALESIVPGARRARGLARALRARAECHRRPPAVRPRRFGHPGRGRTAPDALWRSARWLRPIGRRQARPRAARADSRAGHPRLAYRDVSSSTNRLTLIAAILPARVASTHTVFVVRTRVDVDAQWCLCALLNSFVANFLVRLRVTSHVTAAMMAGLRVPILDRRSALRLELTELARGLSTTRLTSGADYARLQALAAHAYLLDTAQFAHIVSTFPLIDVRDRDAAIAEFERLR